MKLSMSISAHSSGVSRKEVSPSSGGIIGPTWTFGYPYLPMNTEGGEAPASSFESTFAREEVSITPLRTTGQVERPQNIFTPRQSAQRSEPSMKIELSRSPRDSTIAKVKEPLRAVEKRCRHQSRLIWTSCIKRQGRGRDLR
jgi:hypothetical protein